MIPNWGFTQSGRLHSMMYGEIWWADLGLPYGSEPGFKRPVVIIQDNAFNSSNIQTVIVAAITTNLLLAEAPGNVFLEQEVSTLPKDGVINISQIATLDKSRLIDKVSILPAYLISEIQYGIKLIFNLQ